jgi:ribokinase
MLDVITFGSATQDIYTISRRFLSLLGKNFKKTGEGICLLLGSKIKLDNIILTSGGGGTNSAATFALQGLKVSYCGQVGRDCFGEWILERIRDFKINTNLILKSDKKITNLSIFFVCPGKDRTVLTYRGASDDLSKSDIPWNKIRKTKWFYLAPFSGKLANLTETLVNFAKNYNIKVAWNPGYDQLTFSQTLLKKILRKIDILILNRKEASLLTKTPFFKEKEIISKIQKLTKGVIIITKGEEGAIVSDSQCLYKAPALNVKLVDATGAGDAFGSAFVAGMIKKENILWATQLAIANSSFCVTKLGAKAGLLKKGQKWPKVKVIREKN